MGSLEYSGSEDKLTLTQSLLFGCIVSAVDPVAVLAIFQEVSEILDSMNFKFQPMGLLF